MNVVEEEIDKMLERLQTQVLLRIKMAGQLTACACLCEQHSDGGVAGFLMQ